MRYNIWSDARVIACRLRGISYRMWLGSKKRITNALQSLVHSPYTFCLSCICIHAFWTWIVISIAFREGLENRVKSVTHTFATLQRPCTTSCMPVTDGVFTFLVLGCSTMMIILSSASEDSKTSYGFSSPFLLSFIHSPSVLYRMQWERFNLYFLLNPHCFVWGHFMKFLILLFFTLSDIFVATCISSF